MFSFDRAPNDPPETPDRNGRRPSNPFNFQAQHPSTTPLGPPPSSGQTHASTTPIGPPPSSVKALYSAPKYNTAIPFPNSSFADQAYGSSVPYPGEHNGRNSYNDGLDAMDEYGDRMSFSQRAPDGNGLAGAKVNVSAIARTMSTVTTELVESSEMVLQTESVISALYGDTPDSGDRGQSLALSLSESASALVRIWERGMQNNLPHDISEIDIVDPVAKSVLLTSLQLALHHPERETSTKGPNHQVRSAPKPLAETLVNWLNGKFLSHQQDLNRLIQLKPNPAAAEEFWDSTLTYLAHGDVAGVIQLLKTADFAHAATSGLDGFEDGGYRDPQLGNIQHVINRAVQVLSTCPAAQSGDWEVTSSEWSFFRKRVNQAIVDLESFANGPNTMAALGLPSTSLSGSFGMSASKDSTTENRLPRTIYENVKFLYSQLLGNKSEIVASSTSWVDAAIGIAIWSNDSEDEIRNESRRRNRFSLSQAESEMPWSTSKTKYTSRLLSAYNYVMSEHGDAELQIQTISEVEIGLACIFSGDNKGALGIISSWSLTAASAVAEIAALGGWLDPGSVSDRLIGAFDESDLLVLSHGKSPDARLTRDAILSAYADLLARHKTPIVDSATDKQIPGWQVAIQILSRLANRAQSRSQIAELLKGLKIGSRSDLDEMTELCTRLGLEHQVKKLSERYADQLLDKGQDFGEIMLLYAHAQNDTKLTKLLNSLVSLSLTHSMAYPRKHELDQALEALILDPKQTLSSIARTNPEAAALLSRRMSGYAMIRTFYNLRDEEINQSSTEQHQRIPLVKRKQALATLIAVVESAADSIHGGLYDNSVESVVEVEGLLAILGETLPFLDPSLHQIISAPQAFTILRAVEDLTTVAGSIYEKCELCFVATIRNAYDTSSSLPSLALKRGTSDLSNSSQFSLISSGELRTHNSMSVESSGVLVDPEVTRAWDWRKGMTVEADGAALIRILRSQLAKVIATQWAQGS